MLMASRARKTARQWSRTATKRSGRRRPDESAAEDILIGAAVGALGGLIGALVMDQAHKAFDAGKDWLDHQVGNDQGPTLFDGARAGPRAEEDEEEPATAKAATAIAGAAGYDLDTEDKKVGGQIMHFGFAASMGALYGGLAAVARPVTYGHGVPAGALLWAVADEGVVPLLGLSEPPQKYPPSKHIQALSNHLVFGFAVETVRILALRLLGRKA
jgi:putative membrane protein